MRIEITSRSNPKILELLKDKEHFFFFEGAKLVADLLERGIPLEKLIWQPEWREADDGRRFSAKECWEVNGRVMKKLSDLKSAPTVVAVIRNLAEEIAWQEVSLVAALDGIQDPANLGSIFRCAAAFGVPAIALSGKCVRPNHPKLVRAAQTSLLDVGFESYPDLEAIIEKAEKNRFHVYITSPRPGSAAENLARIRFPALIVFGSEGQGIPRALLNRFPSVTIPQEEKMESLNVGIAACILFYELGRMKKP